MSQIQEINYSVNLLESLLWQHNNALKLTAIINYKQEWFKRNQSEFWEDWLRDVFDLRTANEFGVKVWSIILDVPINIVTAPTPTILNDFGFGLDRENFGHGTFGRLGSGTVNVMLEDARIALKIRYFKLICRPTILEINQFLSFVFAGTGMGAYVKDNYDMTYELVFSGNPSPELLTMLIGYDIMPRPAGVGIYVDIPPVVYRPAYGYGVVNENFGNGTFFGD